MVDEELELQEVPGETLVNDKADDSLMSKEAAELSTAALAALAQAVAHQNIAVVGRQNSRRSDQGNPASDPQRMAE